MAASRVQRRMLEEDVDGSHGRSGLARGLWLVIHQPLLDCCGGARVLFVRASCALSHTIVTSHRMVFSSLSRHDRIWKKSGERKTRYADVDALNRSRRPVQTAQTAQLAASTVERAVVCTLHAAACSALLRQWRRRSAIAIEEASVAGCHRVQRALKPSVEPTGA